MSEILNNLKAELESCIETHGIPGASVAVWCGDTEHKATAGILNIDTRVSVTSDSLFMVGSTTKIMTATLLLQLVDEGQVRLDEPASRYLPEVRIDSRPLLEDITIGMLLDHTSGIDGDFFPETGWNEDAIERLVDRLTEVGYLHQSGQMRSYCNAAYCLAGRIIEKLRGQPFDEVLEERLMAPLGISDCVTHPPEYLRFRAAIGHEWNHKNGEWEPSKHAINTRGQLPAGTVVSMSASSLLKIARLHLAGGLAPTGTRIISPELVATLQERLTGVMPDAPTSRIWALTESNGRELFSHYGGTAGQNAWFAILPDSGFAIAVLTNCMTGAFSLNGDLVTRALKETCSFEMPDMNAAIPTFDGDIDQTSFCGSFERYAMDIEVIERNGRLSISVDDKIGELILGDDEFYPLTAVAENKFLIEGQNLIPAPLTVEFYFPEGGKPSTLLFFGRAHRRVAE